VKKSADDLKDKLKDIHEALKDLDGGSSGGDFKEELKPVKDSIEDIHDKIEGAEKSRGEISDKLEEIGDGIKDLDKISDGIKKGASKKDVDNLKETITSEVEDHKNILKSGLTKVGKVAVTNSKYAERIYKDIHEGGEDSS
jgi:uncharacterized coiled-coil DUF342 family protein